MNYHSGAMTAAADPSLLVRLIGITLAGLLGALGGWSLVAALGWSGVPGAVLALFVAMTLATGLFGAWVTLLRAVGRR